MIGTIDKNKTYIKKQKEDEDEKGKKRKRAFNPPAEE